MLVALNVTTAVVGDSIGVVAETIETLTSSESQDQEDLDATETVPSTEETEPSESPSPVPAPSQEETAASVYPVVFTDFDLTAPDGTQISLTGSFPETTTMEVLDFSSDYVADTIIGYDFGITLPEYCVDPKNPVTVSLPFEYDGDFAVCVFDDGITPEITEDYDYEDGVITLNMTSLQPFVIAEVTNLSDGTEVMLKTISASIFEDSTYSTSSDDDMQITITGTLPEGITAKAYPVEDDDEDIIAAYDITLFDEYGNEYQPEFGAVNVIIEGSAIEDAIDEGMSLIVEHEDDNGGVQTVQSDIISNTEISFDAESFSVYRVMKMNMDVDDIDGNSFIIVGYNNYNNRNKRLYMSDVLGNNTSGCNGQFLQSKNITSIFDATAGTITTNDEYIKWTFTKCDETASLEQYPNANMNLPIGEGSFMNVTFTDSNRPQLYYIQDPNGKYLQFNYEDKSSTADGGYYQGFKLVEASDPSEVRPLIVVFAPDGSGRIAIGDYDYAPKGKGNAPHDPTYTFIRARDNQNSTTSWRGFEQCWPESSTSGYWLTLVDKCDTINDQVYIQYLQTPEGDAGDNSVYAGNDWEDVIDRTETGYTIKYPSDVYYDDQSGDYIYEVMGSVNSRYKFLYWEDKATGTRYDPGDPLDPSTMGNVLYLNAVWELEYKYVKVKYDLNITDHIPNSTDDPDVPGADDYFKPEIVGLEEDEYDIIYWYPSGLGQSNVYNVRSLNKNYYNYMWNSNPNNENVQREIKKSALFQGWVNENNTLVFDPDTGIINTDVFFDNISTFDRNPRDGIITLKAKWSKSANNSVSFSILQSVVHVNGDPTNVDNNAGSTHVNHVFGTAFKVVSGDPSEINTSESYQPLRNFLAPYTVDPVTGEVLKTTGVDALVRSSVDSPISGDYHPADAIDGDGNPIAWDHDLDYSDISIQLMDFPDDDEVFAKLRQWAQEDLDNGLTQGSNTLYYTTTVNGVTQRLNILPEELDSDHYSIRWYVVKRQNSDWRIDGKLVRNGSYFAVNKTFVGLDQATIDAMANNPDVDKEYYIEVRETGDSIQDNKAYKLKLEQAATSPVNDRISETDTEVIYGYRDYDSGTFTYTWIVQVEHEGTYTVTEKNYAVHDYGVIAQYSVVSLDGQSDVSLQQWSSVDITAKALKSAVDAVSIDDVNQANLRNTYVKYGLFTIEKVDTDVVGTPMEGVVFKVYDVTDMADAGNSNSEMLGSVLDGSINPFIFEWDPVNKCYKPDSRVYQDVTTDSSGKVSFMIPMEGINDKYTYIVREVVPDGYKDTSVPTFRLDVEAVELDGDLYPNYTFTPIEAGTMITPMDIVYYNDNGDPVDETTSWATIKNTPEDVNITVESTGYNNVNAGVTSFDVTIVGKFVDDDSAFIEKTVRLTNEDLVNGKWTYTGTFPAMSGNRELYYEVTETKINRSAPDTNIWRVEIDDSFLAGDGNPATGSKKQDARTITYDIEHFLTSANYVEVNIKNLDYETDDPITGALFRVYKKDSNGSYTFHYVNADIKAEPIRDINFDSTDPEKLILFEGTYYIEQITPPTTYDVMKGVTEIVVDSNLNVVINKSPSTTDLIKITNTDTTKEIIFYNTKTPPVQTGYTSAATPMSILLVGAVTIMLIGALGKNQEDYEKSTRRIRKVKNNRKLKEVVDGLSQ